MTILVLGAGYAGLAAAVQLTARLGGDEVTVVDAGELFTERMRRHLTATGQPVARLSVPELLRGTRFVRGRVTGVDVRTRTVRVEDETTLTYNTLVYALGTVPDAPAEDHVYTLNGTKLPETGRMVVVGAGLTGIEAATEIAERHPGREVTLLGRTEPGAALHPRASKYLHKVLERHNVRFVRGEAVKIRPASVDLDDGRTIDTEAILWTAGTRVANPPAGLETDHRGRIRTDRNLRSTSNPEVYVVGDAAAIPQPYGLMHGTCQSGMPAGVHAALQIVRARNGRAPEPFRFGYYHTPISLGRRDGIVQFTHPDGSPRPLFLTGPAAARYKEMVTAAPWPAFARMRRWPASGTVWPRGGRWTR